MTRWKRRTRLVSFRLTNEEYELLLKTCLESGARSISSFARDMLLLHLSSGLKRTFGDDLSNLAIYLEEVEMIIKTLRAKVAELQSSRRLVKALSGNQGPTEDFQ